MKAYSVSLYLTAFDVASEAELLERIRHLLDEATDLSFKISGFNAKAWAARDAREVE